MPLPPEGVASRRGGKEESYEDHQEQEELMQQTMDALDLLLKEILNKDMSADGLDTVFKVR